MSVGPGLRRVHVNAGLPGLRAGRWVDLSESDPRVAGWLAAGLVSDVGPRGEEPPDVISRFHCCGVET
jgi:hypothetical protein